MNGIIIENGEQIELDPVYENSMDVVVQHMVASGFDKQFIMDKLFVTADFIEESCTPKAKTK